MQATAAEVRQGLLDAYVRQWAFLRRQLQRKTRSIDLAEDALQETWFRLNGYDADAAYQIRDREAFILRIAGNIAIDLTRREKRHSDRCVSDDELLAAVADATPSAETVLIDRQQLRRMAAALLQLPANARAALLLARCEGLTHAQIAARLGVSPSMVAKYLGQALRHCRDVFRAE